MWDHLIRIATEARLRAYAPYSNFKVGAAIQTLSGKIFPGCNIENSSYGATLCAEQVALANAYVSGEREIEVIAVVADSSRICYPCGICRQIIVELAGESTIVLANLKGDVKICTVSELLPQPFTQDFLY